MERVGTDRPGALEGGGLHHHCPCEQAGDDPINMNREKYIGQQRHIGTHSQTHTNKPDRSKHTAQSHRLTTLAHTIAM